MAHVMTNNYFGWFAAEEDAISEEGWAFGPSLAELQALDNYSAGIKVDGTDYNVAASNQVDDRSFADEAGAQSRGATQASGSVEVYTPGKSDTTSIHARTYERFNKTRTRLALAQRPVKAQLSALVPGDEINISRVITDDRGHNANDNSRTVGMGVKLQDDIFVNYIVPSAVPNAVSVSPAGGVETTIGEPVFLRAVYEGRNVTAGAQYVSTDESVFIVSAGGVVVPVSVGEADLLVSVPGSAPGAPIPVTIEA